jgi:hypothetical protein
VTAGDVTGRVRADPCRKREWDKGEASGERAHAEDVLQVERAEQEEAEDRTGRGEHEEEAAADGAIRQPFDTQERCIGVALDGSEGSEAREAAETAEQSLEGRPAGALTLADREDDGAQACGCKNGSTEVEPSPAWLLRVGGHDLQCGDREYRRHRQVDVEDHPPVAELRQKTADQHADRRARASDSSPGGERFCPLVPVECGHDDRKRCRREQCCTEALPRAGSEQSGR